MKIHFPRFTKIIIYIATISVAHGDHFNLFFLSGQSNATGQAENFTAEPIDSSIEFYSRTENTDSPTWGTLTSRPDETYGPEITLGRTLQSLGYNPSIIKVSKGGTSLHNSWNPNSGPWWNFFVNDTTTAINALTDAGHTVSISGFFWLQGEADGNSNDTATAYEANYANFVSAVRTQLNAPELQFVTALTRERAGFPDRQFVREGQTNVMDLDANGEWFETNDLSVQNDNNHYDTQGIVDIGERFALTYHATQVPEPSFTMLLGLGAFGLLIRRSKTYPF